MKGLVFSFFVFISITVVYGQTTIQEYVQEGISYHDAGDYDKAIASYLKALEIDPISALVNYELSLSNFQKGDYRAAIKYADVAIDQGGDYMLQGYLVKGSCLDNLGKTKKSIKLFESALEKLGGDYLLFYNLGLNYYKEGDTEAAEKNIYSAIDLNPNHSSSHLMLANIHNARGNKVQTLLASYFFLFLEAGSARSIEAFEILESQLYGNVKQDTEKENTINISLFVGEQSEFQAIELMISLLAASNMTEENEGKTWGELFVENTNSFFTLMGEQKEGKSASIWWDFYTPFFYELSQTSHLETFCYYVSHVAKLESQEWLSKNEEKINKFNEWLEE